MNILITGLPGVGKGTQSDLITEKYNVEHLATGNLFRSVIASKSDLGVKLSTYINQGLLVPDELTIQILQEEIKKDKYKKGFLLDGFPRTINQAKFLDKMLLENNLILDAVIALELEEEIIIKRLANRLVCPNCQTTYHKIFVQPKTLGICDKCGTELIQREDDKIESVLKRLSVAKEQTIPVVTYYKDKNMASIIKMMETDNENQVFEKIIKILDQVKI